MRIKRIVAPAFVVIGSLLSGGCESPSEPVSIATAVESVARVELPRPNSYTGLEVSLRLTHPDGASLERLPCTLSLDRFDGQRWVDVYLEMCALPANAGWETIPIVDGKVSYRFMAFEFPAGQYRLSTWVTRAGRMESIPVKAQFELSAAQTQ